MKWRMTSRLRQDAEAKGVISLTDVTLVDAMPTLLNGRAFCFQIVTASRTWIIQAASGQDLYGWVQAMRSAQKFLCMTLPAGKKVAQIDIRLVSAQMSTGIPIQKRKLNRRVIPNCFQGSAAVDWMIGVLRIESRDEAVRLGKALIDQGFVRNADSEDGAFQEFIDSPFQLYQLLKTSG
eukprot:TRINITY_DN4410_c0_g1_i1.p1 TRINITY_DN4410_c0_g1~~TRINITY_DN4410_c0_g1_i1.p1  ORF type:complete len:206 (+),score=25.31 TRINITY_DN4410_c0_g1_i1:84-620(+)